jgi:hypothetical protein
LFAAETWKHALGRAIKQPPGVLTNPASEVPEFVVTTLTDFKAWQHKTPWLPIRSQFGSFS